MSKGFTTFSLILLFSLCSLSPELCAAQERDFGYGAQDILEFKESISHLVVRDINGDSSDDIIFLNNAASRIEILQARPNGFENRGFVLDQWSRSFRVADMNSDGRLDLVLVGNYLGLQIYLQSETGEFKEPQNIYIDEPAQLIDLEAEDINGDGSAEVLLCRQESCTIVENRGGVFTLGDVIPFGADRSCKGVVPLDIDGDADVDLALLFADTEYPVQLKLNRGDGTFGWSFFVDTPPLRALRQLPMETGEGLGVILKNAQVVRLYGGEPHAVSFSLEERVANPLRIAVTGVDDAQEGGYALTDGGIVVSNPRLNQLQFFASDAKEILKKPLSINTLKEVVQIAPLADNRLAVLSQREKAVAVHQLHDGDRFPTYLSCEGNPIAVDSYNNHLCLLQESEGMYSVVEYGSDLTPLHTISLERDITPDAMRVLPLSETQWGILLFRPYEAPLCYVIAESQAVKLEVESFRALSQPLRPSDISLRDLGTVIVAEGTVLREYHFSGQSFSLIRQFNPQRMQAQLHTPISIGDNILCYDALKSEIIVFSHISSEYHTLAMRGGVVGLQHISLLPQGVVLFTPKELLLLPSTVDMITLRKQGEYTTQQKEPGLWNLFPVQVGRGEQGIAVLDYKNRSVELLRYGTDGIDLGVAFEVFQDPGFTESKNSYEPRYVASGDCNGDGIMDLVFLVHDKVLIHFGE
jgi:hypothetical protein